MAKPIPAAKKKAPVAKKKAKAEAKLEIPIKKQLKLSKDAKAELERIEARADERYKWAMSMKQLQPEDVVVALNRMTVIMARMALPVSFTYKGTNYTEAVGEQRLKSIQYKNQLYAAVRMMAACAEWGIRIGNFKAPKGTCLRCDTKVKPSAKKKSKPVVKAKAKKKVKS